MIKQFKIRDINRNPELHKEIFVLKSQCEEMLERFIVAAVAAGADSEELMKGVDDE